MSRGTRRESTVTFEDNDDGVEHDSSFLHRSLRHTESMMIRSGSTFNGSEALSLSTTDYGYVSHPKIPKSRYNYLWELKKRGWWSWISRLALLLPEPLQIVVTIFNLIMELFIGIVYIEAQTHDQTELSFREHDDHVNYFYIKNVCAVFGLVMWVCHVGVVSSFWSSFTFITFVTSGWQLVYAFMGLGSDVSSYYTPIFLRCWVFREYFIRLVHLVPLENTLYQIYRQVAFTLLFLLCVLYSCMGCYRIVEAFHPEGHLRTLNECFYYMVVTFTTVGYGDIFPHSPWGQMVIIGTIFVATAVLPVILSQLQDASELISNLNSYDHNARHIIVAGTPTMKEVMGLLHEMITYSPTRSMVFCSDKPFPQKVLDLATTPIYRNRVVFIEGDIASRSTMERCKGASADAIFLLSDKHGVNCRGDYLVMKNSVAVRRQEPKLPQYLWLKYGTHDFILSSVFTALHRERLKKTIQGIALVSPGVIPLLVNLVRSYNPSQSQLPECMFDAEHSNDWKSLYTHSRANELFIMTPQWPLEDMTFGKAVLTLHRRFRIILLGLGRRDPLSMRINEQATRIKKSEHVLFVIARSVDDVRKAEAELAEQKVVEIVRDGDGFSPDVVAPPSLSQTDPTSTTEDVEMEVANDSFVQSLAAPFRSVTTVKRVEEEECEGEVYEIQNADHFLFVDQSTTISENGLSLHEKVLADRLRREDLLLMMQTVKSLRPNCSTWLVSLVPPSTEFHDAWKALGYEKVVHVCGSALKQEPLCVARAPLAKGVLIYSSAQGKKEYEDAPLFSVDRNLRSLLSMYAENRVQVVVDVHTFTACKYLLPQHLDPEWLRQGEEDFQSSLPFMMGKALAADMFHTLLVQSFYNPLVIKFFDQLLHIPPETFDATHPKFTDKTSRIKALSYGEQRKVIQENEIRLGSMHNEHLKFKTFGEAMEGLLQRLSVIAVGVFREMPDENNAGWIVNRPRYMITNPDAMMPLLDVDMIYFIR